MSIRLRLTLWYSGLVAIAMVVLGVGIYLFVTYNTYETTRSQLRDQYNRLNVRASYSLFNEFELNVGGRVGYEGIYTQIVNYVTGEVKSSARTGDGSAVEFPY